MKQKQTKIEQDDHRKFLTETRKALDEVFKADSQLLFCIGKTNGKVIKGFLAVHKMNEIEVIGHLEKRKLQFVEDYKPRDIDKVLRKILADRD